MTQLQLSMQFIEDVKGLNYNINVLKLNLKLIAFLLYLFYLRFLSFTCISFLNQ